MSVIVEAKVLQRSVFFTGETVQCQVSLTYPTLSATEPYSKGGLPTPSTNILERVEHNHVALEKDEINVAWASAQIYCQCHINESRVLSLNNIKDHHQLPSEMITSFVPTSGETGHCFLATKPVILLCNLRLQRGQTKTFTYTEDIPPSAPPSYRGQAVRFSYKVTIGVGSINGPTKLIRLPIRVISTEGLLVDMKKSADTRESRNPFLEDLSEIEHSLSDLVVDRLTFLTSQRNNNVYNISCRQGSAGKFSLSKLYYRIGEDLQGSFDFTDATVRCLMYKVSLQSEEEVLEKFRKPGSKQKTVHTTYSRYEECCLNCRQTSFCLPIPITATPEFTSKVVSVRWRLHCEVTTSCQNDSGSGESTEIGKTPNRTELDKIITNGPKTGVLHKIPKDVKVETMTWDIPVRVVPSSPILISLLSSNPLFVNDVL
ncbi:RAB6A-GEF complex partner protein 2-like [Rhopilema esculentum]|uniref:RAB6A-GEF complex partner protein 2-like n=1 Tax=Rhopilema esculentum TaxID=499914 RepID=UPI0031DA37AC